MFDSQNTQKLMIEVLGIVIIFAAIMVASRSHKAQYAESARVGFNVIIAIVIGAIGMGAIGYEAFGSKILHFFGMN